MSILKSEEEHIDWLEINSPHYPGRASKLHSESNGVSTRIFTILTNFCLISQTKVLPKLRNSLTKK